MHNWAIVNRFTAQNCIFFMAQPSLIDFGPFLCVFYYISSYKFN